MKVLPVGHTTLLDLLHEYSQFTPVFAPESHNTKPKASTWRFEKLKNFYMATLFRKQGKKQNWKLITQFSYFISGITKFKKII